MLHDLWNHRIWKPPFSKTPLWIPISKTCVFVAWKRNAAYLRMQISVFKFFKTSRCLCTGHWKKVLKSLFLSAYFLFWKILNLNMTFAIRLICLSLNSIILNGDVFSFLAFFPHGNGIKGHWKTQVFKNRPRVGVFEIVGFSFTCERTKKEVFEYDDVIHHRLQASRILSEGCYGISTVLALSCWRAKTI